MTSPSLRKHPITQRSMLRSKCASRLLKKGTVPFRRMTFARQIDNAERDCPLFQRAASASGPLRKGGRGGSLANWLAAPVSSPAVILPLRSLAALCVVYAIAAGPVWGAEGDATNRQTRQAAESDSTIAASEGENILDETEVLEAPPAIAPPRKPASKPVPKRSRAVSQESGRTGSAVTDLTKPQSAG